MSSGDGSAVDKLVEALKQPSPLANNNAQGTGAFAEVRALIAKGDGLIESLSQRLWKQGAVALSPEASVTTGSPSSKPTPTFAAKSPKSSAHARSKYSRCSFRRSKSVGLT